MVYVSSGLYAVGDGLIPVKFNIGSGLLEVPILNDGRVFIAILVADEVSYEPGPGISFSLS